MSDLILSFQGFAAGGFGTPVPAISLPPYAAMNVPKTREVIADNLTRILIDGPEVSLRGSPTVSPSTAAACSGVDLVTFWAPCRFLPHPV